MLDDANFDDKVANACILKLFTLEEWIQKHTPKQAFDWNDGQDKINPFGWERIVENELNHTIKLVEHCYDNMQYKAVIKNAFMELQKLKESYIIASGGNPNPRLMMHLLEVVLVLMNPIIPYYCQY